MLPRRPDRPTAYEDYRWPVELTAEGIVTDEPSALGSLFIPQRRGAVVRAEQLVHQVGDAEVLAIDELVGTTVVTLHTLRHAGGLREYLVFYGSLAETSPGLKRGANVAPQTVIGKVGDSGQPGSVRLYLEVRQLRRNVDPKGLPMPELRHPARSIACDPRNVFPLR